MPHNSLTSTLVLGNVATKARDYTVTLIVPIFIADTVYRDVGIVTGSPGQIETLVTMIAPTVLLLCLSLDPFRINNIRQRAALLRVRSHITSNHGGPIVAFQRGTRA